MAVSAKSLFRAMKPKPPAHPELFPEMPDKVRPEQRDPLDYDPTPPSATKAFLAAEMPHLERHGSEIWETAVGGGHIADVLERLDFQVIGTDVVDRGWDGTTLRSFYDHDKRLADIELTNPPYGQINARDGAGRWFWHGQSLGLPYRALLLNADWPAARINGMDRLFRECPPSIEYLCCWKIDFRGGGSPPQRNSWFVWDVNRPAIGPDIWPRARLFRWATDSDQGSLL